MASAKKRPSIRSKAAVKTRTTGETPSKSQPSSQISSKKNKRTVKHVQLLDRIKAGGVQKRQHRPRRPGNKIKAVNDVSELRDALPDVGCNSEGGEDEWEGLSGSDTDMPESVNKAAAKTRRKRSKPQGDSKMLMKSLNHRPGAMKRKRKMEQGEMERFGKNLAQLSGSETNGKGGMAEAGVSQGDKWAALRRFIGSTMETDKAFGAG